MQILIDTTVDGTEEITDAWNALGAILQGRGAPSPRLIRTDPANSLKDFERPAHPGSMADTPAKPKLGTVLTAGKVADAPPPPPPPAPGAPTQDFIPGQRRPSSESVPKGPPPPPSNYSPDGGSDPGDTDVDTGDEPPAGGTPPAPGEALQYDEEGYPWDSRIHILVKGVKKRKLDGGWMLKRGIDQNLVTAVRASAVRQIPLEKAGTATPPPPPKAPPPPAPGATTAASATPPPPPATPASLTPAERFKVLMQQVRAWTLENKLSQAGLEAALATAGLKTSELHLLTMPQNEHLLSIVETTLPQQVTA